MENRQASESVMICFPWINEALQHITLIDFFYYFCAIKRVNSALFHFSHFFTASPQQITLIMQTHWSWSGVSAQIELALSNGYSICVVTSKTCRTLFSMLIMMPNQTFTVDDCSDKTAFGGFPITISVLIISRDSIQSFFFNSLSNSVTRSCAHDTET